MALAATGVPADAGTHACLPGGPRARGSMVWMRLQRVACLGVGLVASSGPRRHATAPWADVAAEAVETVLAEP